MAAAGDEQDELRPIERPGLLIVEGKEERRVFACLLRHLDIGGVDIRPVGGKQRLRRNVLSIGRSPAFASNVRALGIVRDADDDPANAFKSVCGALREAGLAVPEEPCTTCGNAPRVGAMILPGGNRPGALEDLCYESVQEDPAIPCVDGYFDCLKEVKLDAAPDSAKKKAHVFIASRPGEARLLGEAAEAGVWPWDSPAFDEVKEFVRKLFA